MTALRRRTDIIVATPGRLADLINQGECDLADVEVMVIDEADQMADLGFLPIVRRLLESTPADGQRMLFSATLDAAIDVLVRRFLNNPATHSVNENSSPAEIEHHVLTIDPARKLEVLAALVGGDKRSLVFTRTKHGAERLARQLTELGIPAAELHGNLRQGARARNLAAFSNGIARVMVATDIAARGIHVDGIDLVIHADPPAEHKAYVHRSGRTARGGADGVVVTLQMRSQAREVTAMMRKAGITPHTAAAYDPESDVLREIGGPPAPRVTVSGKVSELVRPEDRLAANGAGGPGGRGGYGRGGAGRSRDDRPRRDRQGGGRTAATATAATGPLPAAATGPTASAPARDPPRDFGDGGSSGDSRVQRPSQFDGDRGRAATFRAATAPGSRRRSSATTSRHRDGGRLRRRRPAFSGEDARSAATATTGTTGGQRPERNDWWPRENRPASGNGPAGEYRRPGAAGGWRPAGAGAPNRSASGYRPVRDSRNGERAGRTATDPVAATGRRRAAGRVRPGPVPAIPPGATGPTRRRIAGQGRHF